MRSYATPFGGFLVARFRFCYYYATPFGGFTAIEAGSNKNSYRLKASCDSGILRREIATSLSDGCRPNAPRNDEEYSSMVTLENPGVS